MKNKKSQASMEFLVTYGWAILVVLVVIASVGALWYFGVFDNWLIGHYCDLEPDKCVCEKWEAVEYDPISFETCFNISDACDKVITQITVGDPNKCLKQRKKTDEELEIDKCNREPDNEDCFCEEYEIEYYEKWYYKLEFLEKYCTQSLKGFYEWQEQKELEIINNGDYPIKLQEYGFDSNDSWICVVPERQRENMSNMDIIETDKIRFKYCLKARPKTECEKGDENWVEHEILQHDCLEWEQNFTCIGINGFEVCSIDCIKYSDGTIEKMCREKTEVEKLMNKDCDYLLNGLSTEIQQCRVKIQIMTGCDYNYLKNLKSAFKQKGCKL